ncbi:MAG: MBL fold metallo-hydrolase [Actinomycetota bacterium]
MGQVSAAADGIHAIDTRMCGRERVTSAYLVAGDEPAIVETGPTTSLDALLEGIHAVGIGPHDLAHIVVTHIHLDHAGGAGALAPHFPDATVWVHERGARHLADPTRLQKSAARVYGGEERLLELFGPLHPIPIERIESPEDGGKISLGNRWLEALHTPGHASHHMCLVDSETGALFTGDALGVFLPDVRILRPATPPPEFDLELAVASIERVAERNPSVLLFSHFGSAEEVAHLCTLAVHRLRKWTRIVEEALRETENLVAITDRLRAETSPEYHSAVGDRAEEIGDRYELLSSYEMNAMGLIRYLSR